MLTSVVRPSARRLATSLPLRPLVSGAQAARPFSATRWAGEAAKAEPKEAAAKPKKTKKKAALTPEARAKAEIKELKEKALLQEPKKVADTAWTVYITQELKGRSVGGDLAGMTRTLSESFKGLSTSEMGHLQNTADANRASNAASYKSWVESHPVEAIHEANRARARLSRKYKQPNRKITDDRLPRRPATVYTLFIKEKWASGEVGGTATGASKDLARAWKELSEGEKQIYRDAAAREQAIYADSMKTVMGKSP